MGTISNVKVRPSKVILGGVDLGFTEGDLEIKTEEMGVEVTAHQEGTNVLDMIRTGKKVELEVTLKELSAAQLQALLGYGGGNDSGVAEVTTIACIADVSGSLNNRFFLLNGAGGLKYCVWMNVASAGVDPSIPGYTSVEVVLATNATANDVADAVAAALDPLAAFVAPNPGAATVTCTNATAGDVSAPDAGNSGFTLTVTVEGVSQLYGWGKSKDFSSMADDAAKLVLHPIANASTNYAEDIAFWKAYPMLGSIKQSGENPQTASVSFKIFPDMAKPDATRLFVFGDHT
jgi:hypothetical protein